MKIALIGYGKMGKAIEAVAEKASHKIVARIDDRQSEQWLLLPDADVAIEFTQPEAAPENIARCIKAEIPVVTGTTGWYQQLPEVTTQVNAAKGALLYASNFSIGVNLFMEVNRVLAALMDHQPQYDVAMTETHHTEKLDTPSGTAITLAEDIIAQLNRKRNWINSASKNPESLGIISHREPGVPGTHEVTYCSQIDEIQLIHTAKSRAGFAQGAVAAAEWLIGNRGVFTMKDVLNLTHHK